MSVNKKIKYENVFILEAHLMEIDFIAIFWLYRMYKDCQTNFRKKHCDKFKIFGTKKKNILLLRL